MSSSTNTLEKVGFRKVFGSISNKTDNANKDETEAEKVYNSDKLMNESAGAYDSLPPNLTDSESDYDSESEPESDKECVMRGYKSNIVMNKSARAYDSLPPNLTESEPESNVESELEYDQYT